MRLSKVSEPPAPNSHSPLRFTQPERRKLGRGYSGLGSACISIILIAGDQVRPPLETASGLAAVLRGVVADMQHPSKAAVVSVSLYEEASRTYYAPFATGQPQESLLDSLTDMREQLARYSGDLSQGKVPDEIGVHHYGSTVWLPETRQKRIATEAPSA